MSTLNRMAAEPLQIEVSTAGKPGTRILKLKGRMVLGNYLQLQNELRKEKAPLTIIDLSEVSHIDSTGMGEIVNYYVHCQRAGHRLIISGATPHLLNLFEITRINTILPLVATIEEALK